MIGKEDRYWTIGSKVKRLLLLAREMVYKVHLSLIALAQRAQMSSTQ